MRIIIFIISVFITLSAYSEMYIGEVKQKKGITLISFPDFRGAGKHLSINGVAKIKMDEFSLTEQKRLMLRLTPRTPNVNGHVAGSSYVKYPFRGFDNSYSFSTFFRFRITGANLYDGSGLVFVIHSDERHDKALGKCTYCLGFAGNALIGKRVKPSIGIEFDVHAGATDHDYNMIGLNFHGSLKSKFIHTGAFLPNSRSVFYETPYADRPINNGKPWNVWIDFDGKIFEVRSSQEDVKSLATLHLRREVNMRDAMSLRRERGEEDEPFVYIGFSADPGRFPAYTDVLEWYLRPCDIPFGNFYGNKLDVIDSKRVENQNIKCD